MKNQTNELMDKIGPYTSAGGFFIFVFTVYVIGSILSTQTTTEVGKVASGTVTCLSSLFVLFTPLFFCTCMHRHKKYKIISLGGIGGMLGLVVGYLLSFLLSPLFIVALFLPGFGEIFIDKYSFSYLHVGFISFFIYLFSWYFCRKFGKRWWNEKVCQCGK
ncbi:MAG: hypothetical protein QW620_06460 [Thermoplasmata archaeon]